MADLKGVQRDGLGPARLELKFLSSEEITMEEAGLLRENNFQLATWKFLTQLHFQVLTAFEDGIQRK